MHQVLTANSTKNIAVNAFIPKDYVINVKKQNLLYWGCICTQAYAEGEGNSRFITPELIVE